MYYLKYINSPNLGDSCTDPCVSPVDATVCSTLKGDKRCVGMSTPLSLVLAALTVALAQLRTQSHRWLLLQGCLAISNGSTVPDKQGP